jgi:hypothetical protein
MSKFSIGHVFRYPRSRSQSPSLWSTLILSNYLHGLPNDCQRQDFSIRNVRMLHFFSDMYALAFTIVTIVYLHLSPLILIPFHVFSTSTIIGQNSLYVYTFSPKYLYIKKEFINYKNVMLLFSVFLISAILPVFRS